MIRLNEKKQCGQTRGICRMRRNDRRWEKERRFYRIFMKP